MGPSHFRVMRHMSPRRDVYVVASIVGSVVSCDPRELVKTLYWCCDSDRPARRYPATEISALSARDFPRVHLSGCRTHASNTGCFDWHHSQNINKAKEEAEDCLHSNQVLLELRKTCGLCLHSNQVLLELRKTCLGSEVQAGTSRQVLL
ncbi:hypothetical protein STEG23_022261, partial [Scotinomys teguina]